MSSHARFPILLSGFMGTGKSTVGKLLAAKLHARFVDLDSELEAEAGISIAEQFQRDGEPAFRARERSLLLRLVAEGSLAPAIVSLGGGALLDRETRLHCLESATVVTLTATPGEILARLQRNPGELARRPLLAGADPEARIQSLLAARASSYMECHAQVATGTRSPEAVADAVLEALWCSTIAVASGEDSYVVRVGSGVLSRGLGEMVGQPSGVLIVSDDNVAPLYLERASAALKSAAGGETRPLHSVLLKPGEEYKNLEGLEQIFAAAFDSHMDRKATFLGLGGGVVTDMTGFAAASWLRGVRWIGAPSTLLSMVDASVGGKTAVDFRTAKNSIGAFWQPRGVVCDVDLLATETDRAFVGALSEVVKTALIGDAALFSYLEENAPAILARERAALCHIVESSVRVKAAVVARDPTEKGLRATLNLGHTIGHALESAGGYSALTHGEAVSLGLVAALRLGEQMGRTPADLSLRVLRLLQKLGLPHALSRPALEQAASLIGYDKKRAGNSVQFIFAKALGQCVIEPVALSELVRLAPTLA
jgi:shikimate kinase / 3-dehydroquinate synthase